MCGRYVSLEEAEIERFWPANSMIRLDLSDGSVDVLGRTNSGIYSLVYSICEIGNLTNCDQVTIELSGGL